MNVRDVGEGREGKDVQSCRDGWPRCHRERREAAWSYSSRGGGGGKEISKRKGIKPKKGADLCTANSGFPTNTVKKDQRIKSQQKEKAMNRVRKKERKRRKGGEKGEHLW